MSTEFLRKNAAALKDHATETAARAQAAPDDFFLKLAAENQRQAAQDAARDLALAESDESSELIDLRFIGPRATGSIPLEWFVKAVDPLATAWKLAAHRLRHGFQASRGVGSDIAQTLNLKLAGLAYGSTRILVTGNALPDLTGESLLQATLVQTFRLLQSKHEDFYDAVDAIGGRAAHKISGFLKALDDGGYATELSWRSPGGLRRWEGGSDEIARIRVLLDTIREPERYEETIIGRVAGITDTGRLELRTEDGKVAIRFPLKLTDQVRGLSITVLARVRVRTAKYWDAVDKRDIFKRELVHVDDVRGGAPLI
jgi:hypothetical protein